MQICKTPEELFTVTENSIIGAEGLTMQNSDIRFQGTGNLLFVEEGVRLVGCNLKFFGSNCLIYLSANSHEYRTDITVYNNSVVFIGKNNYFNGALHMIASEQKHIFIGDDGLFAFGIWLRTADPHLVYSTKTKQRVNPSRSVFLGDHVWIGQDALVLKGTQIGSGSILGAGAVCSGKHIESNASYAGNPARRLAGDVFWEQSSVHAYTDRETAAHSSMKTDKYTFSFSEKEFLAFDQLDEQLSALQSAEERLKRLQTLALNKTKNRFATVNDLPKAKKHGLFHK